MITYIELNAVLTDSGIRQEAIQIFDEEFVLPTSHWITHDLGASLDKFFFDTGIKFGYNQYECNKFAKTATTIADWSWAKTKTRDVALAFGMFGYIGGVDGHMINIAVHRDSASKLYLAFYEPQPFVAEGEMAFRLVCLTQKTLSKEDIRSCISCLFL
jgi:hypothetical protein